VRGEALRKIGRAAGVIFLRAISAARAVEMSLEHGRIVVAAAKRAPRAGWAQASRCLAADGGEGLVWPECANAGDKALKW
jgi:antitoxin MazE